MALLAATAAVNAQQPPDAGALQQQIQRDLEKSLPEAKPLPPPVAEPAPVPVDAAVVTAGAFTFTGNTLFTGEQLQAAVAGYLNRPLSFNDLQKAAGAVADVYRKGGWIVRVFLPPQELKNGGTVTIQVVEARFGELQLEREHPDDLLLVDPERLRLMVYTAQPLGEPVSAHKVDRALLLLDDLPGISATGALAAGKVEGQTDFAVKVANERRFTGDVRLDNTGSRSTGVERLAGNVSWASPTHAGDSLATNLLFTKGSNYIRVGYRRPVGYDGWMAGGSASYMNYELVDDFAVFQSDGLATTWGLEASYPILRARQYSLSFQVAPEFKHYDNEALKVTTTRYDINAIPVTLTGNRSDTWLGGGSFSGNVSVTFGEVDLDGSPNKTADALTAKTAGNFTKFRYAINRNQRINDKWSWRAALSGQFAQKNLDSAEKFYIGGLSAVRAYSSADGSGAEGMLLNLELRGSLPHNVVATAFYDRGEVTVNVDNKFPGAPALNDYGLDGVGLSLGWSHPKGANAKVTWARRIADNPNPDIKGNDQDGTKTIDRFWLEAGMTF